MRFRAPFLLVLAACASIVEISPGVPYQLGRRETIRVPACDMTIRFIDVRDDSRCPTGVECVWAGDAEVLLEIGDGAGSRIESFRLSESSAERPGPCTVRISELRPYPRSPKTIDPDLYAVTLEVGAREGDG